MFDGAAAEQLHQFIAAAAAAASLTSPPFDPHHHPYNNIINPSSNSNSQYHLLLQPHHELNQQVVNIPGNVLDHQEKEESRSASNGLASVINDEDDNQAAWGNDELLALLRIRSTMENWFPEFTWEHVSRKLAELGFKRSAEKCKEKFEIETSYFNKNNFRFLADLENLYQDHAPPPPPVPAETNNNPQKSDENNKLPEKLPIVSDRDDEVEDSARNTEKVPQKERKKKGKSVNVKKRKRRQRRFEMLKGFCTDVVKRMMEAQEEMHEKLLEDMVRRNEDKVAREEAWKVKETERMNMELEKMAKEQAAAGDRQSQIIKFLKKFASSENPSPNVDPSKNPDEPTSLTTVQNNPTTPPPKTLAHHPQSPNFSDLGKRWPRDEVLALINLRSGLFSNGSGSSENIGQDKDGGVTKAPLWERISQGMLEKGYNRSAKRCKEKWENINKYFRKTKDVNKKRSLDSRTCPYFHQLSSLYNQGALIVPGSDNQPSEGHCPTAKPENRGSGDGGEGNGMAVQEVVPEGGS